MKRRIIGCMFSIICILLLTSPGLSQQDFDSVLAEVENLVILASQLSSLTPPDGIANPEGYQELLKTVVEVLLAGTDTPLKHELSQHTIHNERLLVQGIGRNTATTPIVDAYVGITFLNADGEVFAVKFYPLQTIEGESLFPFEVVTDIPDRYDSFEIIFLVASEWYSATPGRDGSTPEVPSRTKFTVQVDEWFELMNSYVHENELVLELRNKWIDACRFHIVFYDLNRRVVADLVHQGCIPAGTTRVIRVSLEEVESSLVTDVMVRR